MQNALFATLDPTTRQSTLADGRDVVFTDTVGFVRHLPTQLVEAFRSTLEESTEADLLVHVVDASDPDPVGQINAVRTVLNEIGANVIIHANHLLRSAYPAMLDTAQKILDAGRSKEVDDQIMSIKEVLRLIPE